MKRKYKILVAMALCILLFCGWMLWGNLTFGVTRYTVESEKLPASFEGYRVAHVSDLHNTQWGKGNKKLLSAIEKADPDLIAITGDLIDSRRTDTQVAINFVREASKIAPVYYVPGNHEGRMSDEEWRLFSSALVMEGATLAGNAIIPIKRGEDMICLAGIVDPNVAPYTADLVEAAAAGDEFTLLLCHRPELFPDYVAAGVELALCGHIHGGQFRLPFVGGLYAPGQGIFPDYDGGLYSEGETNMVVSRGLGNSRFPIRLNNRPELIIVELTR